MKNVQTLIVGGGPSGLAAAYALQGDTLVVERESKVGGLCRSFHHGCGVFDIGGHSFHTPYPEVFELVQSLLEDGLYLQRREARVYSHGAIIPYPFQKFFDRLPNSEVVSACERGLRDAEANLVEAKDFEDYIIRKFGQGIAEHFMLPYNRKLWARDLKEISAEWTSERVAGPKGENERFETTGGERKPLQSDTKVGYPQIGGYEEIYKSFVPHISGLELNSEVVHIDPQSHVATTSDERQYHWEFLVSTVPLPILIQIVEGTPDEVKRLANNLKYMSLREEFFLVEQRLDPLIQRIYIADSEIPPHKIVLNHNSSAYLREKHCHAIMAEVSISPQKRVAVDDIVPKTVEFLCSVDILHAPDDVVWQGHLDVEYAYPIYTHRRPMSVSGIRDWMAQHHIHTLGRFGEWEYINSDKCVMKGLALGRDLRERYLGM